MNAKEQYLPSEHPLGRLRECGLDKYFKGQKTLVKCPLCTEPLYVFVHKESQVQGFYTCKNCAWFHARPILFDLLKKAEQPGWKPQSSAAIGKQLDKVVRSVLPAVYRNRYKYGNLSGAKRKA